MSSLLDSLISLTDVERSALLASLSDAQACDLLYDWSLWARAAQCAPGGVWTTWLVLAGRGFGKTRTGAEWIRAEVESGRRGRLALIAPTAADVRDTMIEGESGILAISRPDFQPTYEPSRRRLTWPNGAMALTFSAEEPERLRGPQHDGGWCLVGSTRIAMGDGTTRNLADIRAGDLVQTRSGPRHVTAHTLTNTAAPLMRVCTMGGRVIFGTADHLVYAGERGFVQIQALVAGDQVCVLPTSNSTDSAFTSTRAAITQRASVSIERSGSKRTGRFHRAITSTIATVISRTTALTTWCCSVMESTLPNTSNDSAIIEIERERTRLLHRIASVRNAVNANWSARCVNPSTTAGPSRHHDSVPQIVSSALDRLRSRENSACVNSALLRMQLRDALNDIVRGGATTEHVKRACRVPESDCWHVQNAGLSSEASEATHGSALAIVPRFSTDVIYSVERLPITAPVFDIAIEGDSEFFANGILVHNCDELAAWRYGQECWDMFTFGLRLGANPQVVVTTTPRPTPLLRTIMSDPHTTITRGTTYDNLSNLAPTFARQIIARYEGTRLGRQELNAEILDDVPGALWNRAMLDADRVRLDAVPPMRRVVVAVDPAVTAREDSDETGIVVAGLGEDGHGYVLDDLTVRASPNGWAQRVLLGYDKWSADRIIGERNNGGEMVEYVIRSLRANAPFAAVHASKGKYTRAEPVSALYEQHRVHHVGALPTLEDQMCSFTSNGTADGHDDRVDALVWALTELLVGGAALPFGWMTQDEEA